MVEVWNIMKFKIILLLAALLLSLSHPALSGQGCGTNWLGSDINDPDFYVSKNQNLGASSGSSAPAASTAKTNQLSTDSPAIKIGESSKAGSATIISSLLPDKPSPQGAGTIITWTAAANQSDMLFKFFLKGPATNDQLTEMTNWTASNVWVWNTTASDIGDSQIEVRARDGKHAGPEGFDDSKDARFTIEKSSSENKSLASELSDPNPHPPSRTSGSESIITKPRVAPDERHLLPLSAGNPDGPNMSMPDPSPKPLKSAASSAGAVEASSIQDEAASTSDLLPSEEASADANGKWLVSLDNSGESMELTLIQTGASIMGYGNLVGETKIPLTASGSLDNDKLKLNVKTVVGKYVNQIDKHYEMDLKLADDALSGSYQGYSGETSTSKGHVAATRPGA